MTRAQGKRRRAMTSPEDFDSTTDDGTTDTSTDTSADPTDDGTRPASDVQDRDFYNIFDGTKGRTESTYLDIQERIQAEKLRARAEGREPDLSNVGNLPAAVGTPLVIDEMRVDNRYANPSVDLTGHKDVDPVATLPVELGAGDQRVDLSQAAQVARERKSQDEALLEAASQGDSGNESAPAADVDRSVTGSGNFNTSTNF